MDELKIMADSAAEKLATTGMEVVRPPKARNEKEKAPLHTGDLYLCPESLAAFEGALGGVCEGVDAVFEGTKNGRPFPFHQPVQERCGFILNIWFTRYTQMF
jgi:histone deacetylase HOS3